MAVFRSVALSALCYLGFGLLAPTAGAAQAWQAPATISSSTPDALHADLAVDSQGDAVAVWAGYDGANSIIQSAARPAGGAWSAPVNLSAAAQGESGPRVAVDSQGDAVAVWEEYGGANSIIQSAARPAGGAWSAPVNLSAAGEYSYGPSIAMDPQGDAVVVWTAHSTHAVYSVQNAVKPADGLWSAPITLYTADGIYLGGALVAADSQGDAVAVWQRLNDTPTTQAWILQGAGMAAAGSWSAPATLSPVAEGAWGSYSVAMDSQGNALAVWDQFLGNFDWAVESAARPLTGAWSVPVTLSGAGGGSYSSVALNPQGQAVAVWLGDAFQQGATGTGAGAWSTPVKLDTVGRAQGAPQVAVDSSGNAVALWNGYYEGNQEVIKSASKTAAGTWEAPVVVYTACKSSCGVLEPKLAVDSRGDAVAVWTEYDGANSIIQAAVGQELAAPSYAKTVLAALVSGVVLIKVRGSHGFVRLSGSQLIPVGSTIDATKGRVRLTSAKNRGGGTETADFYSGGFKVLQPIHGKPTTELDLVSGGRHARLGRLALGHKKSNGLWGNGHGNYVSKGRHGSATVRGTIWFTQDRASGTFFKVKKDTVVVRDFTRHRKKILHAGQHYLAPAH